MIDGKTPVLKYLSTLHPRSQNLINDLGEQLPGFTATDNPSGASMGNDAMKVLLFGPMDDAGVALRVNEGPHGLYVLGLDLLIAVAILLRVGPPVWSRSDIEMGDYWKGLIAQCQPFAAPEPAPKTRAEMETHIDGCELCQPVSQAMALAIDAGSSAYKDEDVCEMIERAHHDQAAAIAHYLQKQAAHSMGPMTGSTPSGKPSRGKPAAEPVTA